MSKKNRPTLKPWVHLEEGHVFNQTNGVVDVTDDPVRTGTGEAESSLGAAGLGGMSF